MKKSTRGGARLGSGRKPKPKDVKRVNRSFSLASQTLAWIEGESEAKGITVGHVVDGLVSKLSNPVGDEA